MNSDRSTLICKAIIHIRDESYFKVADSVVSFPICAACSVTMNVCMLQCYVCMQSNPNHVDTNFDPFRREYAIRSFYSFIFKLDTQSCFAFGQYVCNPIRDGAHEIRICHWISQ